MATNENLPLNVIRQLAKELKNLDESPPEGIKVIVNDDDFTTIFADIEGPAVHRSGASIPLGPGTSLKINKITKQDEGNTSNQAKYKGKTFPRPGPWSRLPGNLKFSGTPYEDGVFRMKLLLSRDFPHSPPKGFFSTKIFHPNIATSGEICVNTLKKDWNPSLGLRHVLLIVRCLLIEPFPESALNEQAGKMLLENYEEYARLARLYTGIHAHKHKNKSKTGAICESTTSLNVGQSNKTALSKNTPSPSSASTSTKVLGLHDQNAAPCDPSVGTSVHRKDRLLAAKIPVEKKRTDARKKSLKRL